jgi:hypothetical protein
MMEYIALVGAFALWLSLGIRQRARRSEALSTPVAREQELRRSGL